MVAIGTSRTFISRLIADVAKSARTAAAPRGETCLKKIPQPSEFNDLLSRQNSGDQFTLRGGVNLIEMQLRNGLRRELPYAFVKRALSNEVGHGAADTLIIERRPFPENIRCAGPSRLLTSSNRFAKSCSLGLEMLG